MAKLQAKCLTVSYSPFALHVRPQRCRTRQISKILVCNGQKLLLIVAMLIDRLMWVYYEQYLAAVDQFWFNDWQTDAVSKWPTANHVRHFAATSLSLCYSSCVESIMRFFYMAAYTHIRVVRNLWIRWRSKSIAVKWNGMQAQCPHDVRLSPSCLQAGPHENRRRLQETAAELNVKLYI